MQRSRDGDRIQERRLRGSQPYELRAGAACAKREKGTIGQGKETLDLRAQGHLKDETAEMLQLMRSRMHRMESLIEGLLEYSRAGRIHHAPEPVDVRRLVREGLVQIL